MAAHARFLDEDSPHYFLIEESIRQLESLKQSIASKKDKEVYNCCVLQYNQQLDTLEQTHQLIAERVFMLE